MLLEKDLRWDIGVLCCPCSEAREREVRRPVDGDGDEGRCGSAGDLGTREGALRVADAARAMRRGGGDEEKGGKEEGEEGSEELHDAAVVGLGEPRTGCERARTAGTGGEGDASGRMDAERVIDLPSKR